MPLDINWDIPKYWMQKNRTGKIAYVRLKDGAVIVRTKDLKRLVNDESEKIPMYYGRVVEGLVSHRDFETGVERYNKEMKRRNQVNQTDKSTQ